MSSVLTVASQVLCTHGGHVILETTNTLLSAGGSAVLLQSDLHQVGGCPFVAGLTPMPCVLVQWEAGATMLSVNSVPVLLSTSVGQCINALGAPQGVAIVVEAEPNLGAI